MIDQGPGWRNIKTTGLLDVSELHTQLAAKDAEIARLRTDFDIQDALAEEIIDLPDEEFQDRQERIYLRKMLLKRDKLCSAKDAEIARLKDAFENAWTVWRQEERTLEQQLAQTALTVTRLEAERDAWKAEVAKQEDIHDALLADLNSEMEGMQAYIPKLQDALRKIADNPCGIPGHSVAVGCGSNVIARAALKEAK